MELRHLKAFVTVAEELNFRRAAARLQMSQPPLSQQIKRLERDVGVSLLRRTTRQVALTPAGHAFLAEARIALKAAQTAPEAARQAAAGQIGAVRLGFSGPTSHEALVLMTKKFRAHRPHVRLEVLGPFLAGEMVELLNRDEVDAGLIRLPVAGSGIQVRILTRHPVTVALPAEHPLAGREKVDLRDLCDEPVVSHPTNRGAGLVSLIHSAYLKYGSSPNIVQEAPDTHTILSLVGAGVGIGFVPSPAGHLKVPGVVLLPVSGIPPVALALAWRREDPNPALHALLELLDEVSAECSVQPDASV
ncbi:LysR substrate-binding domain-containing protein [Streptomyces gilvus]|uniref:LysR substrate-binding domain-containing protein n=1 Tax=Streptomyces gilvus TaxID=2920937 RepID=UPI001F106A94|nr:LysR substrate-binding domain-containing protein [Streptomyces sp. CME 23]MCH5675628.1 LysR substrate-binding domain-containing protein [Streptomyces sp. CME 23]